MQKWQVGSHIFNMQTKLIIKIRKKDSNSTHLFTKNSLVFISHHNLFWNYIIQNVFVIENLFLTKILSISSICKMWSINLTFSNEKATLKDTTNEKQTVNCILTKNTFFHRSSEIFVAAPFDVLF